MNRQSGGSRACGVDEARACSKEIVLKVGACISLYLGINQVIVYFDIAIPIRLNPAIIIPEIITLNVPDCVVVHLIVFEVSVCNTMPVLA